MKQLLILSTIVFLMSSQSNATGFNFKFKYAFLEPASPDQILASVRFDNTVSDCMVDTGARFTVAKKSILGSNTKVGEKSGGGISGQERVTELVESKVQVGDWIHGTSIIGRTEDDALPSPCLLGNDFFLDREFSFDFDKKKVTDESSFSGTTFPIQKYRGDIGGHFGFKIEIQGEEIPTLFDTGTTDTVFDIQFVEAHPENFEFVREIDVQEGSNQTIKAGVYNMKSVKMGSIEQTNIKVYVLSLKYLQSKIPGIQAVLGLSQMINHKWYINNKKSVWGIY